MIRRRYRIVDVFSERPLAGNALCVVLDVTIHQGVEMGRPCRIDVHAEFGAVRVGGRVTACAEGAFTL